ncbi:hypothetical protein AALO_G00101450 [Alosa alosa]|uniref:Uncharacterized protein n=1 Tax=Alosa alosa TaxID=278164 RepID=A0AAV6GUW3_9TELE|nr:hypothetical protein AALO_G00101450 [Alosa alosa]
MHLMGSDECPPREKGGWSECVLVLPVTAEVEEEEEEEEDVQARAAAAAFPELGEPASRTRRPSRGLSLGIRPPTPGDLGSAPLRTCRD